MPLLPFNFLSACYRMCICIFSNFFSEKRTEQFYSRWVLLAVECQSLDRCNNGQKKNEEKKRRRICMCVTSTECFNCFIVFIVVHVFPKSLAVKWHADMHNNPETYLVIYFATMPSLSFADEWHIVYCLSISIDLRWFSWSLRICFNVHPTMVWQSVSIINEWNEFNGRNLIVTNNDNIKCVLSDNLCKIKRQNLSRFLTPLCWVTPLLNNLQ